MIDSYLTAEIAETHKPPLSLERARERSEPTQN
jgi:hypothetical protein